MPIVIVPGSNVTFKAGLQELDDRKMVVMDGYAIARFRAPKSTAKDLP